MQLTFDNATAGSTTIESPNWPDVEAAIRAMNGSSCTEVGLFVDSDTFLQIGGGADVYVCSIRSNGKLHVLFDPERTANEAKWVVAGQGSNYPANECFPVTPIIDVAKWFWEHNTPSSQYRWNVF